LQTSNKSDRRGNTGGLTGPCIKPIAIKLVWEAVKAVKIPIIGMGGIQIAEHTGSA
jgi:dihydroorotate dehydrogenase